eukprot:CAMPEP_0201156952 /NCGR_PEP_ID=MMETSP0851-20130426/30003_1 /ASSEMBLY_ACC=CAM_ASM_000631 /TAXON_ID=183588 /ORGANISM="Pseudo-nitzschia fraudulenta, Strain WWA7" /LENGTH=68 /DNA_ID=CAMNT_0047435169 /DNA_START=29 /DNA_END=231 /DNA_ORIENTATION=-
MTNTANGGKEDPTDPHYANTNTNTNARSTDTPAVHSAKNDSISTENDRVLTNYSSNNSPPGPSARATR